jgi:hypothetical protein
MEGMAKSGGRSAKEVEQIVLEFERSGLSRREYCERRGIARPTLDWYRRRVQAGRNSPSLVQVRIEKAKAPVIDGAGDGFTLVLANGCRIETGWNFGEAELARLIRIAGAA